MKLIIILLLIPFYTFGQVTGRPPSQVTPNTSPAGPDYTNLVSWYSFDESEGDLKDKHGSDDGTVTDGGGSMYGATGKINDGFEFERTGETDYVTLATGPAPGSSNFTILGWVNRESATVDHTVWGGNITDACAFEINTNGTLRLSEVSGTGSQSTVISVSIGVLTFIAASYDQDADEITFYINDNSEVESYSATFTQNSDNIGSKYGTSWSYDGIMDEWAWFSEAMNATQIMYYYNEGNGKGYGQ